MFQQLNFRPSVMQPPPTLPELSAGGGTLLIQTTRQESWTRQSVIEGKYELNGQTSHLGYSSFPLRKLSPVLRQLKGRQADMIKRALEYRSEHGDPVHNLVTLLEGLVDGDLQQWDRIVDEPYG
jgi:hypothetical protein